MAGAFSKAFSKAFDIGSDRLRIFRMTSATTKRPGMTVAADRAWPGLDISTAHAARSGIKRGE